MRLNKYLSGKGLCSRREADAWIDAGRVRINGVIAELGTPVEDHDEVQVDGRVVSSRSKPHVTIAFNKPVGVTCTTEARVRDKSPWWLPGAVDAEIAGRGDLRLEPLAGLVDRPGAHRLARPFVGVGLLGGWTTFSALAVDAVQLGHADQAIGLHAAHQRNHMDGDGVAAFLLAVLQFKIDIDGNGNLFLGTTINDAFKIGINLWLGEWTRGRLPTANRCDT